MEVQVAMDVGSVAVITLFSVAAPNPLVLGAIGVMGATAFFVGVAG